MYRRPTHLVISGRTDRENSSSGPWLLAECGHLTELTPDEGFRLIPLDQPVRCPVCAGARIKEAAP
jgi:hypothetical protein